MARGRPGTLLHRLRRKNDVSNRAARLASEDRRSKKLFDTGLVPDPTVNQYAVTKDGLKFLVLEPRKGFLESYSAILNWPATLQ